MDAKPVDVSTRPSAGGEADTPSILWTARTSHSALADDEVHIWCAALDQPVDHRQAIAQSLSEDERQRAERFHFERDRNRYLVGRGLLRTILGLYLETRPSELTFCYSSRGKPSLARATRDIHFNLAHSGSLVLYAMTRRRPVGIDLEVIRPIREIKEIAQRFFSSAETARLLSLPEDQREKGFFNCWTRKEAYLKATGEGITAPLDQFEVSLVPEEPAALLHHQLDPGEASRWFLCDLNPAPGYTAALAVKERCLRIQCWQWSFFGLSR